MPLFVRFAYVVFFGTLRVRTAGTAVCFFSVRFAYVRPARLLIPVAGYPATPCAAAPACRLRLGYVLGQNAALRAVGSPPSVSSIFLTILRASPKKLRTACILARFPWSCLKWYISGTCHVLSSFDRPAALRAASPLLAVSAIYLAIRPDSYKNYARCAFS